jgi:hypothetical protein
MIDPRVLLEAKMAVFILVVKSGGAKRRRGASGLWGFGSNS